MYVCAFKTEIIPPTLLTTKKNANWTNKNPKRITKCVTDTFNLISINKMSVQCKKNEGFNEK